MKLIMRYFVSDECTYSYYVTLPFEYELVEKAEFDFFELCEAAKNTSRSVYDPFNFACHCYDYSNFYRYDIYIDPDIYTLEDWFEIYKGKV